MTTGCRSENSDLPEAPPQSPYDFSVHMWMQNVPDYITDDIIDLIDIIKRKGFAVKLAQIDERYKITEP